MDPAVPPPGTDFKEVSEDVHENIQMKDHHRVIYHKSIRKGRELKGPWILREEEMTTVRAPAGQKPGRETVRRPSEEHRAMNKARWGVAIPGKQAGLRGTKRQSWQSSLATGTSQPRRPAQAGG